MDLIQLHKNESYLESISINLGRWHLAVQLRSYETGIERYVHSYIFYRHNRPFGKGLNWWINNTGCWPDLKKRWWKIWQKFGVCSNGITMCSIHWYSSLD